MPVPLEKNTGFVRGVALYVCTKGNNVQLLVHADEGGILWTGQSVIELHCPF